MAIGDYILCCKCEVKLIYDGDRPTNREWWKERFGAEPEIECPDCKPKREWVSLTDEEMSEAMGYWSDKSRSAYGGAFAADGEYVDMVATWRYIEAKLKQNNGYQKGESD